MKDMEFQSIILESSNIIRTVKEELNKINNDTIENVVEEINNDIDILLESFIDFINDKISIDQFIDILHYTTLRDIKSNIPEIIKTFRTSESWETKEFKYIDIASNFLKQAIDNILWYYNNYIEKENYPQLGYSISKWELHKAFQKYGEFIDKMKSNYSFI